MRTTGSWTGSPPCERSVSAIECASCTGRVMTTRFPESTDGECSATGAVNLLQDCTRTCVNQQLREALPQFAGLVGGASGALADVVAPIGRAHDGVHGQFVPFETRPRSERDLTAPLQCAEQRAFGNNRLT